MQLYGYPVGIATIDKNMYDKKNIIETIENNFKKDKKRNKWDIFSDLHHVYNDERNPNQQQVNWETLFPLYKIAFNNYFKHIFKSVDIEYDMQIANYTCMEKSNYMGEHIHYSSFSAIHYIQFDEENHSPTCFINPYSHGDYFGMIFHKNINSLLDKRNILSSWAFNKWHLGMKEDELVITPGIMKHRVDPQKSKNKNRITVVINANILNPSS
tara:strand:- start:122 stop:760 length:639 start_codon:yes stop_codon:yes gene_type:complete